MSETEVTDRVWVDAWAIRAARAKAHADKHWPDGATLVERIAMMHGELSEALEGYRCGNPASDHIPPFSSLEEEFADVVIRMMHVGLAEPLRLAQAIDAKLEHNEARSLAHGGKLL